MDRNWRCCYCCVKDYEDKTFSWWYKTITCYDCNCNCAHLCYHLIMIIYFLIFFWIDLFAYLCTIIKTYVVISGENETKELI